MAKNHRTLYILELKRSSDSNKFQSSLGNQNDDANNDHLKHCSGIVNLKALKAAAPEWTFGQIDFVAAVVKDYFYINLTCLAYKQGRGRGKKSGGARETHMRSA